MAASSLLGMTGPRSLTVRAEYSIACGAVGSHSHACDRTTDAISQAGQQWSRRRRRWLRSKGITVWHLLRLVEQWLIPSSLAVGLAWQKAVGIAIGHGVAFALKGPLLLLVLFLLIRGIVRETRYLWNLLQDVRAGRGTAHQ